VVPSPPPTTRTTLLRDAFLQSCVHVRVEREVCVCVWVCVCVSVCVRVCLSPFHCQGATRIAVLFVSGVRGELCVHEDRDIV